MSMETGAQKRTILIVEDSEALLKLLSTQLEMEGYNTIMAADGQEGWDALENDPLPDVVLLDVMMPRMNGFELCELIRSTPRTATLPVVILTALKDQKSRIKGIEAGANDFIGKPWSKEELYARIRTLIRLKDVQDRLKRQHERLQFLYDVSRDLATRAAMDQMLSAVLSNSISATGANGGSIVALGVDGPLAKVSNDGQDEPVAEVKPQLTPLEQRSVTQLFRDIKPQLLQSDSLADIESAVHSVLAVPIVQGRQMIGFITLTSRAEDQFNSGHVELIDAIARQAAISMDRTKLFAQVRSERRRFSVLIASMGDAVVAFDNQLRVTLLNPSAVEFLGSPEESLRGRSASEIITNDAFLGLLSRASENRADQYEEITWNGKHLLTTVSPIGSEGLVSVFQDITFIKELQEAQLQLVEEKAKRVRATFNRYMSPELVDRALNEEGLMDKRERRNVAILFADMRGFTRMTAMFAPDDVVAILNEFFTELTQIAYAHQGTIIDIAGDELEVGFGVPFDLDDPCALAVRAGLEMQRVYRGLAKKWQQHYGDKRLGLGIGIDFGEVIVGNVGSPTRMNYALVGLAVNASHALVTMAADGEVRFSTSVHENMVDNELDANVESVSDVELKGREGPNTIYVATPAGT